jgi:hypothetical protein
MQWSIVVENQQVFEEVPPNPLFYLHPSFMPFQLVYQKNLLGKSFAKIPLTSS